MEEEHVWAILIIMLFTTAIIAIAGGYAYNHNKDVRRVCLDYCNYNTDDGNVYANCAEACGTLISCNQDKETVQEIIENGEWY